MADEGVVMLSPNRTYLIQASRLSLLLAIAGCADKDAPGSLASMEPSVTDPEEGEEDAGEDPEDPDEEDEDSAPEETLDAGAPASADASTSAPKDAAVTDARASTSDAGGTKADAGTKDAGTTPLDAGQKPTDAGQTHDSTAPADSGPAQNAAFLRGETLVANNACTSCHQGDLSGTAFYPNITPDQATGIGSWTDAQISAAINQGVGNDGAKLCALMARYKFNASDLSDLIAYLRGIPAVENEIDSVCPGHGK
jgi:hypothetical protein